MFHAKRAVLCALAALALAACASTTKPPAGSLTKSGHLVARGKIDDPRSKHVTCMQQHGLSVTEHGYYTIQVGRPGVGPLLHVLPTPGAAQEAQISGQIESAEVIGGTLLYPNKASDGELKIVESCAALGIKG